MTKRVVIYSESSGVFLGMALGLGFWSELDAAGMDRAPTYPNEEAALAAVSSWRTQPEAPWRCVPVDVAGEVATIDDCVRAGLPAWTP